MAKFLFVYRNHPENMGQPSPEEMQRIMAQWAAWFQKLGDAVVDGGDALLPDGKSIAADGTVTDGPFIEAKELLGGYSILQAGSAEALAALLRDHPHAAWGGTIETLEMLAMPGR